MHSDGVELDEARKCVAALEEQVKNLQANIDGIVNAREEYRVKYEAAESARRNQEGTIKMLQAQLAAKEGLGIASTAGDTHVDIRQKIREGLADQQRFHKS